MRPITLNRKNALFAGHDEGGIASLIDSCKVNGMEPFAYLKATLTAIATGHPQSRLDDLLPWNFKPSSQCAGGASDRLRMKRCAAS